MIVKSVMIWQLQQVHDWLESTPSSYPDTSSSHMQGLKFRSDLAKLSVGDSPPYSSHSIFNNEGSLTVT